MTIEISYKQENNPNDNSNPIRHFFLVTQNSITSKDTGIIYTFNNKDAKDVVFQVLALGNWRIENKLNNYCNFIAVNGEQFDLSKTVRSLLYLLKKEIIGKDLQFYNVYNYLNKINVCKNLTPKNELEAIFINKSINFYWHKITTQISNKK